MTPKVPSRRARRRSIRHAEGLSSVDLAEDASEDADASERALVGVIADPATALIRADAVPDPAGELLTLASGDGPPGIVELLALPVVRDVRPIHPLRRIVESRTSIAKGARLLGVSERSLREVIAWRARFPPAKERWFARWLRIDVDELFPSPPQR